MCATALKQCGYRIPDRHYSRAVAHQLADSKLTVHKFTYGVRSRRRRPTASAPAPNPQQPKGGAVWTVRSAGSSASALVSAPPQLTGVQNARLRTPDQPIRRENPQWSPRRPRTYSSRGGPQRNRHGPRADLGGRPAATRSYFGLLCDQRPIRHLESQYQSRLSSKGVAGSDQPARCF